MPYLVGWARRDAGKKLACVDRGPGSKKIFCGEESISKRPVTWLIKTQEYGQVKVCYRRLPQVSKMMIQAKKEKKSRQSGLEPL